MLNIRLLGTPRVFLDDVQISIQRRTTRSLLFYLAMHPKGVRREELIELFFGHQEDGEKQRQNFRRTLNYVRNIAKGEKIVENHYDTIFLNASFVSVDALVLLETVEKIKKTKGSFRNGGRTIPLAIYQDALDAVALLQGETFIDSTDMDKIAFLSHWKETENSRLRNARNTLFTFLADTDSRRGNAEKASLWAKRALKSGASEEASYLLLKSLRELGELEKARKYFLELKEDFGMDLSERLLSLGEEILEMPEASPLHVRHNWAIRPGISVPFVGHDETLERMRVNYQHGVGSLISGETGEGKTALVKQFYESLPVPPNLLRVPCYQNIESLPYQPWTDMLRHSFDKEFWQTTPASWTKLLTALLPELHKYRDDLGVNPGAVFEDVLIFEAMKDLLSYASKKGAVLLFVEDSHWMDRTSFSLLKYLILRSTFNPWNIGLVVTSRLGIQSGVEYFEQDAMLEKLEAIEIPPLGKTEIEYLASYLLNEKVPDEKVSYLQKMTAGNPFFLLELLSFHVTNSNVDIFEQYSVSPPGFKKLFDARFHTLPPLAQKVLGYAAIQGNQFSVAIPTEALDLSMEEMTSVVTLFEKARLVEFVRNNGEFFYTFRHEMVRKEILNILSPADLRIIHTKIAKVLSKKRIYQDKYAAILAKHYEGAGALSEAFLAWLAAAEYAYHNFSSEDAHLVYQKAELLLPHLSLSEQELFEFYSTWGRMLFNSDNSDALEGVMQSMFAHGERLHSSLLIGVALDGLSDVHMARNQFKEGLERVEEALPYLIRAGHIPTQMEAFIHQGVFLYMLNDFPASLNSFRKVLSLGAERTDPRSIHAIGGANYQMAVSLTGMGYPLEAIRYAKESLHVMRITNVPHSSLLPYSIMGLANYYIGRYHEGKQNAISGLDLAQKTNTWRIAGYAAAYAGMNEAELPELGLAWQHAQQAIQYGEKYGHTEIVSMGYKIFGDIYARLDAPLQAAKFYQLGVDVDIASFAKLENAARLGVTLGLLGDPQADAALEQALLHAKTAGLETIEVYARALQLSLFIAREDYESFDANCESIRTAIVERSHPKGFVWIDYLQSQRLYQEGKLEEALTLLEKALPILDEIEFFWIDLRAYILHLSLLKTFGRDTASTRTKLAEMLNKIEAGLGDAPLQEEWQIFSKKIREM